MLDNWTQLMKKLNKDAELNKVPISGQFELTARCNLRCKMCYVCQPAGSNSIASQELSAGDWIRLAREAKKAGMLHLLLTGGEVFLRKDFRQIYEALSSMGFYIKIYTNGTLIDPETARWLRTIPPHGMELTLYGASPETYRAVTGNPGAYDKAVNGLDLLISEGINVQLRTTVIKDNAADYEKILEIADKRGLQLKFVFYVSGRRGENSSNIDKIRLSAYEISQYEKRCNSDFTKRYQSESSDTQNGTSPDNDYEKNHCGNSPFKCSAGVTSFWITWDGRMSPCAIIDDCVTYPLSDGFNQAWKELVTLCGAFPSCSQCRECKLLDHCWTCPARLRIETGSFEKTSPYLCEWAEYRKLSVMG